MAFDPDAYLAADAPAPAAFDPDAYLAAKPPPKPAEPPGFLRRAAKYLGVPTSVREAGETAADAVTGLTSLGAGVIDPAISAAGVAGSYLVPHTGQGSPLERFHNEMEQRRAAREEGAKRSPVTTMAAALAPAVIAPELAAKVPMPFSRGASAAPGALGFLSRFGSGVADAALLNAGTAAGTHLDDHPLDAAAGALASPANLLGGAGAAAVEAGQAAGRVAPSLGRALGRALPKVEPTDAAKLLRKEGVPITLGQENPNSTYAALEQASADNPLGMHAERVAAQDSARDVAINRTTAPGQEPAAPGRVQDRLRGQREGFDAAYAPLKAHEIPARAVADMPGAALKPVEGIRDSTRARAAAEIKDALTILPPDVVEGQQAAIPEGADPFKIPSRTQTVKLPEGEHSAQATIPLWLHPDDFHQNRAAWDWTFAATGGPDAPEQMQKLVYPYMRNAVENAGTDFEFGANAGAPKSDFEFKQGWTAARLAKGLGGAKWQGLRETLRDWALAPEHVRGGDPIGKSYPGRDPWGALVDSTRRDINWGHGNAYGNTEKIDALNKFLNETKVSLDPARFDFKSSPPPWYQEGYVGSPATAQEAAAMQANAPKPITAGDLIKVRKHLRDSIREARSGSQPDLDRVKALEHAEDVITGTIEANIPPESAAKLRDTDRQYARFSTLEGAAPAGQENFTPGQWLRSQERSAGRARFKEGRAGEDQALGQASQETFDSRVKPTGMRQSILNAAGKYGGVAVGPAMRLLNSPSVKAGILREAMAAVPAPGMPVIRPDAASRALALAQAARGRVSLAMPGARLRPAAADEDEARR